MFLSEAKLPESEGGPVSVEARRDHERDSGWYSSEVIAFALRRTFQYEIVFPPLDDGSLTRFWQSDCVGALTHHVDEEGRGVHWTALRRCGSRAWFLDSCLAPKLMLQEDVRNHVQSHVERCYPVFYLGAPVHGAPEEVRVGDLAPTTSVPSVDLEPSEEVVPEVQAASALAEQLQRTLHELEERVRMLRLKCEGHEKALVKLRGQAEMPGAGHLRLPLREQMTTVVLQKLRSHFQIPITICFFYARS